MTDAERAAALADEIENSRVNLYTDPRLEFSHLQRGDRNLAVRALRLLAEQSAPSPASADLREVVARAVYSALDPQGSDPWEQAVARKARLGSEPTPMVKQAIQATDAAISAISAAGYVILPREPTPSMLYRGGGMVPGDSRDIVSARIIWSVMVDAALSAKEPAP